MPFTKFFSFARLFLFLIFIVVCSGCEKEGSKRVKYEVRCPGGCNIVYKSGIYVHETKRGNWSVSQNISEGSEYYLFAVKTSLIGVLRVRVYIDGELIEADEDNSPYSSISFRGEVQ